MSPAEIAVRHSRRNDPGAARRTETEGRPVVKFGLLALDEAEGAILAHTVRWKSGTLRKGIRLDRARIALLREAGVGPVMAAREDADDVHEDEAARKMAASLAPEPEACGLRRGPARRGRVNFFALHSACCVWSGTRSPPSTG